MAFYQLIAQRILFVMMGFILLYGAIAGRLIWLASTPAPAEASYFPKTTDRLAMRPDLLDRNGQILATDIKVFSLYAEPRRILDADEAIEKLSTVFPSLRTPALRARLDSDAGFLWLKREITPDEHRRLHNLGIPGIGFLEETQRFVPGGALAGHVIGHVNVDNQGIAGIEKYLDTQGLRELQQMGLTQNQSLKPVQLSLDLRVQHVMRDELQKALELYRAIAGIGIILDVHTGEVLALSSLPDYDPNSPAQALDPERINRAVAGVFEMGSVFKIFTTAMALDSEKISLGDSFDATHPIRVSRYTISDFHGKRRVLSVPEVFIYSSNIGTAKMALAVGIEGQKAFLQKMGLLSRLETELPETARPILPPKWTELTAMTVSFGHGLSVSPLQTAAAAAVLVNGGKRVHPTFLRQRQEGKKEALFQEAGGGSGLIEAKTATETVQVIKPTTSLMMRYLFRLNVEEGSGRRADVPGYRVGGKTGTAEKVEKGRYVASKRFNTFIATFPVDAPRYIVLVALDEPKPAKENLSATAGLNAAPTVGAVIQRVAPMLGIVPRFDQNAQTLSASYHLF